MRETGNVIAAFTPLAWNAQHYKGVMDFSGRTCIVSLVNQLHQRPFRLKLKAGYIAVYMSRSRGPVFGKTGDVALMALNISASYFRPSSSFELDQEAEQKAGLPPLPCSYDYKLLAGMREESQGFRLAEVEVYTLDA